MTLVYFIRPIGRDGPIKIGCSKNPERRLLSIAVWSPWPLELIGSAPGTPDDERLLQEHFLNDRSHLEWFHSSPELREIIGSILSCGFDSVRERLQSKGNIRAARRSPWTAWRARRASYRTRLWQAEKHCHSKGVALFVPDEIRRIMLSWDRRADASLPSDEEIARLEAFIANPHPRPQAAAS